MTRSPLVSAMTDENSNVALSVDNARELAAPSYSPEIPATVVASESSRCSTISEAMR